MKRALIGAGGFAREVKAHMLDHTMECFVDDVYWDGSDEYILPLSRFNPGDYKVFVAVGDPKARRKMIQSLPENTEYFSFVHPSAQLLGNDINIGEGSFVCAGCILTTNVNIGKHAHLNLYTTIGHDCKIGDFFTTAPGAKVSGNCSIGDCVYVGTNSSVKEKVKIHSHVIVGLNAGVVKDIVTPGIYIGTPAENLIVVK